MTVNNQTKDIMQIYSNPERESDPGALPDVEIFYMSDGDILDAGKDTYWYDYETSEPLRRGWYHWYCAPGCLPDSGPTGPFETAQAAIDAARED